MVRLQVALIVFCCVGRATEQADERVASRPGSVRACDPRLDSGDMGGKGGGQFHTRPINAVPGACPSTNQPVGHHHFYLVGALARNSNAEAAGKVFEDVAVEAGVQLLLGHRQDVVEDVLPGLAVEPTGSWCSSCTGPSPAVPRLRLRLPTYF